jgi:glucose-1-phosphate adenylyltransferase
LTQFNTQSLHRHIHKAYKFDIFSNNFVEILAAEQTDRTADWYQGTADAVRRNLWHMTDPDVDKVLILSGDQIYRMDFRDIIKSHDNAKAEVTIAATIKKPEEADGLGILKIDRQFRIIDFIEKPSKNEMKDLIVQGEDLAMLGVKATGDVVLASMGIYLFNKARLETSLDNEMTDFGKNVIPWCIKNMRVFVHPFLDYWEDVGTIRAYFDAHMQLTEDKPEFNFYDQKHPIYTHPRFLPNTRVTGDSKITHSIISEGADIDNSELDHCVIGIRSIIASGCSLKNVIMMGQDSYSNDEDIYFNSGLPARGIGRNCQIEGTICDKGVRIGDNVIIKAKYNRPNEDGDCYYIRDGIVIIPKNAIVPDGRVI